MKRTRRLSLAAAATLGLVSGLAMSAQDSRSQPNRPDTPPMTPEQRAQGKAKMDRIMALEEPGAMQQWLKRYEGTWRVEVKEDWGAGHDAKHDPAMDKSKPKAPADSTDAPESSAAVARTEIKHGRHAETSVKGTHNGRPFEGAGVLAYNNLARRFECTWHDNMHTGISFASGQLDSAQKELTLTGECTDDTGKRMTTRSTTRWISDDQYVTEYYGTAGDSTAERRMAVMTFTRDHTIPGVPGTRPDSAADGTGRRNENPR